MRSFVVIFEAQPKPGHTDARPGTPFAVNVQADTPAEACRLARRQALDPACSLPEHPYTYRTTAEALDAA